MDSKLKQYILIRLGILIAVFYIFAIVAYKAAADEVYSSAMIGVFNSGKNSLSETKLVSFGVRQDLFMGLVQQFEGGGWIDIAGHGRQSSPYAAYQVGVETSHVITARVMTGPCIIGSPDSYLGGVFPEFKEDFFLGIRGDNTNTVGVKYQHISNAGIFNPNVGRDFMGVEVGVSF